jgi:phenylalanyl-tRNA synthetase beta chain
MRELTGATALSGTIDVAAPSVDEVPPPIVLRDVRVQSLLGAPVARERSAEILVALGFGVSDVDDGLEVVVPHFRRRDVTREADLIEEVARINGFDSLPSTVQENRTGGAGRLSHAQRLRRRAEDVLAGRGLHEVVGWSFTEPSVLDRLRLDADHKLRRYVTVENPMSEAQSIMRPTIVPSLLDIAAHNAAHGRPDIAIFESGAVYLRGEKLAIEHHALAGLVTGATAPASWATGSAAAADFFTAKGLVEAVCGALRVDAGFAAAADWPFLHPGRSAEVLVSGARIGFVGEVHPLVASQWGLQANSVGIFAVDLGRLIEAAPSTITYSDVTSFPAIRQDFAVVVDEHVPAAQVVGVVARLADSVEVFDVYRGEQLGEGRKSIALRCEFSAQDRTLTEDDATRIREKIVKRLADELGGELRG